MWGILMKMFAVIACLFMLLPAAHAGYANSTQDGDTAYYTQSSIMDGWLNVTRTIEMNSSTPSCIAIGFTGACGNVGAAAGNISNTALTSVTILVENIGQLDRDDLVVIESLSFVPQGAKLSFYPPAQSYDGGKASWSLGALKIGESKNISYSFSARLSSGAAGRIPDAEVGATPVGLVLSAPDGAYTGGKITLFLRTEDGPAMHGAEITVGTPGGTQMRLLTNNDGIATFYAANDGNYAYSVDGYELEGGTSTAVKPKPVAEMPAVAAAAIDTQIVSAIVKVLPMLAAVFAVAVVMLFAYNFIYARKEKVQETQAAEPPQGPSGPVYTQKFSFGDEVKQDKKIDDMTRDIISSRKKQMSDSERQPDGNDQAEGTDGEAPTLDSPEKAVMEEELEGEIALLEEEARKGGEGASEGTVDGIAVLEETAREAGESADGEGRSIEETIAELEKIREKLREKRSRMKDETGNAAEYEPKPYGSGREEGGGDGEEKEPHGSGILLEDEAKRPRMPQRKRAASDDDGPEEARKAHPKAKKAKLSYRGVRKRK